MDAAELERLVVATDAGSLERYLAAFELTLSVMQDAPALERIAYEVAEDAATEGVRYLEVRWSPILNTREGLPLEAAVEAALAGLSRAQATLDIRASAIVCALRHLEPSTSRRLADLAVAYGDRGVVGLDLAGPESGHPARDHREAFLVAAEAGLGVTIHAGEDDGPDSIRQALDDCHARRIGHGTRLAEDAALVDRVEDERIPLEVCLTSNVQTGAAPSYARHPVRRYLDRGLQVTLNTDNRLVSGTTLTDELWKAHRHLGFDWDELVRVSRSAFEHAFLPADERTHLLAAFDEALRS